MKRLVAILTVALLVSPVLAEDRDAAEIFDRIPRTSLIHKYPNEAWKRLVALDKEGRTTLTSAEYVAAQRDLAAALAHEKKLIDEPDFREVCALAERVRLDPSFGGVPTSVRWTPPFVVFVEKTERGVPAEELTEALSTLHETFRREFVKPLDLPELGSLPAADRRLLKVFIFASRASLRECQKRIRQVTADSAVYRRTDQWLLAAAGHDATVHLLLHDAVHQLVHAFTKTVMERELREEVIWTDPRARSRLGWFQEGLAELLASRRRKDDGTLELLVPSASRIAEWKAARAKKCSEWSFEELMEVGGGGDLSRRSKIKGLGRDEAERLHSLFHAQAWAFAHYAFTVHRDKFRAYLGKELSGRSGPALFRKLFTDEEWKALRAGWEIYVEGLLA